MNKSFSSSFKAFAIVALLSNINGFAMEAVSEAATIAEVVAALEPAKEVIVVVAEPAKAAEVVTVAEVVKEAVKDVVVATVEPIKAVEAAAVAAVEPVKEAVEAAVVAAPAEAKKACTDCSLTKKIKNGWNSAVTSVSSKKAEIVAAAKDMKARGWTGWSSKEKAGVVIGATAVAAVTAYVAYRIYKSLTATPKAKANTRNNRA